MMSISQPSGTDLNVALDNRLSIIRQNINDGYIKVDMILVKDNVRIDKSDMSIILELKECVECENFVDDYLELMTTSLFNISIDDIISSISRCIEHGYKKSLEAILKFVLKKNIRAHSLFLLVKYRPYNEEIYSLAKTAGFNDPGYDGLIDTRDLTELNYIGYRVAQHILYYENPIHLKFLLNYWSTVERFNCTYDAAQDLLVGHVKRDSIWPEDELLEYERTRLDKTSLIVFEKMCRKLVINISFEEFREKYWTKKIVTLIDRL